ncbi:hypothetical protein [Prevotella sp. HUN102]|uniref:hypothetical protein n=1 Tax=Prevotella sp. HUN102 TaxID=1392486 RepID=UPI00048D7488|nr:hypothetical protein [Prevotella sp. HUN102]
MELFYILYAVLLIVLAPFLTIGIGCMGFLFFFALSMGIPVIGPVLWAWLWSPGNKTQNVRLTIALHILVACLILIWLLSTT